MQIKATLFRFLHENHAKTMNLFFHISQMHTPMCWSAMWNPRNINYMFWLLLDKMYKKKNQQLLHSDIFILTLAEINARTRTSTNSDLCI